jgi:translin
VTNFDSIIAGLQAEMEGRHAAREAALKESRAVIQVCSRAIKSIHRRQWDAAQAGLAEAAERLKAARGLSADHPEILYAGHLQDAEKELVEGLATWALVKGTDLPAPGDSGVAAPAYLNGLGEAASECRRTVLDQMRRGDLDLAEALLERMERVQDELAQFDFPDGLTGGLRRTNDALRAVVERTRSDLTLTRVQNRLIDELKKASDPAAR